MPQRAAKSSRSLTVKLLRCCLKSMNSITPFSDAGCQHLKVTSLVSYGTMNDEQLVRLERFRSVCQERGIIGPVQIAKALGKSASFWSDLLRGAKSFGEKLAREIEEKMSLPRGWLDGTFGVAPMTMGTLNGFEGQLITLFRRLPPDRQHELLADIDREAHGPPTPATKANSTGR